MANVSTGALSIPYGTSLRIGYRNNGSSGSYTYLTTFPSYNDLPYEYTLPSGTIQVEYSTICLTCGGARYSDPQIVVAIIP